jgi:hypothetical protein
MVQQVLPISAYVAFDNTGARYDPKAIFTNGSIDVEKYKAYSPLLLSTTFAMAIGISCAAFTTLLVHVFCACFERCFSSRYAHSGVTVWHRNDIMNRFTRTLRDERDIHSRLMQSYPEVPLTWYGIVGLISLGMSIAAIEIFPTQLPVWGLLLAIAFSALWSLPAGMIQAMTNQQMPFLGWRN